MSPRNIALAAAVVIAPFIATPAFADDKADILAVVGKFMDASNKADASAAAAACADQTAIVDMFPPFAWQGAGSCATWISDAVADNKKNDLTEMIGKFGKTPPPIISGDGAYAPMPATFTYKMKGKAQKPLTGIWAFTLHKSAAGWRITGIGWGLK